MSGERVAVCECPCHQNADQKAREAGGRLEGHPPVSPGVPLATVTLGVVGAKPVGYCTRCGAVLMLWLLEQERKRLQRVEADAAVEELIRSSHKPGGF